MILVTGGSGFIGSHLVHLLVSEGRPVRVLDLQAPASSGRCDAQYIRGDVTDPSAVARALRRVSAVCHLAAKVGMGRDMLDVADYARQNDLGTATLVRHLAQSGFRGRLVLAGSMVVYGEGAYRCPVHGHVSAAPRDCAQLADGRFEPRCRCGRELRPTAVDESAPLDPRSVYAATKVHQEHLCFAFSRETGIPVTALRYHNVYGPGMPRDTPYAGVASIFASQIASGRPAQVFEDGKQLRDFVHVRDVARASVIALTCPDPQRGAFNIASGTPRTVLEMARALTRATGAQAPEPRVTGQFRLGDVRHVYASARRASEVLGFRAREDFDHGLAELSRDLAAARAAQPVAS